MLKRDTIYVYDTLGTVLCILDKAHVVRVDIDDMQPPQVGIVMPKKATIMFDDGRYGSYERVDLERLFNDFEPNTDYDTEET